MKPFVVDLRERRGVRPHAHRRQGRRTCPRGKRRSRTLARRGPDHGVLRRGRRRRRRRCSTPRCAKHSNVPTADAPTSWRAVRRSSRTRRSPPWPVSSIPSSGSTATTRSSPRSRRCSRRASARARWTVPIAVLVQPLLEPTFGGVMFGIDPVSGRTDRRVVTAVHGGPEALVSGEVNGSQYVLTDQGKVVEFQANDGAELESRRTPAARRRSRVTSPASSEDRRTSSGRSPTTERCGSCSRGPSPPRPAACRAGRSTARDRSRKPFPNRSPNSNTTSGFRRSAKPSARRCCSPARRHAPSVDASEVVVAVDGHVAIDLRLAGELVPKRTVAHRLNPIPAVPPPARRVARRTVAFGTAESVRTLCSTASTPISRRSRPSTISRAVN